jgi:hypothetical protein
MAAPIVLGILGRAVAGPLGRIIVGSFGRVAAFNAVGAIVPDYADCSNSECVAQAWYLNGTMFVIFESGPKTYEYEVSRDSWEDFVDAPSKGRWLHDHVL